MFWGITDVIRVGDAWGKFIFDFIMSRKQLNISVINVLSIFEFLECIESVACIVQNRKGIILMN
jgi:hypothetical protein